MSDVAKYVRRSSLYEAVERLGEARQQALRLYAVGRHTPFAPLGLTSVRDVAPFEVPDELLGTYALPEDRVSLLAAADRLARFLDASAVAALGASVETPWAATARARLAAARAHG